MRLTSLIALLMAGAIALGVLVATRQMRPGAAVESLPAGPTARGPGAGAAEATPAGGRGGAAGRAGATPAPGEPARG